jgi:hypothetical protein
MRSFQGVDMRSFGFAAASVLVLVCGAALAAQDSIGAAYGAREPARCADRKQPAQGALTAAQATQYLKCTVEGIGDGRLFLLDEVKVELAGPGRAYDTRTDYYEGADQKQMIYPIKGSQTRYECEELSIRGMVAGQQCRKMVEANATGACFKTTAGDWACNMSDVRQITTEKVAPPK